MDTLRLRDCPLNMGIQKAFEPRLYLISNPQYLASAGNQKSYARAFQPKNGSCFPLVSQVRGKAKKEKYHGT